ncbi:tRNA (guanosine(46)-N7)-methyltransferase TrmB [Paenibacillus thiaminolyticus]|uniref:tRNA (guanosine(46)-N7)-methyltransferase TrmB n=1 Tax=Paenibacillus thiaminolyticus TaxID=49283 RepID=UPI00116395FD|nr:tRNA (guanosine(46)-N7)-methyltransferase TrmB [Paenibacillus thiaminolyticus]MDG0874319.1 tRNA (guanosine(46)-N7)-methyltransferase TrmB [Paenibacillus thiaminolyticus]NGP57892.1 tRNA (guanosine(46)-N7)-methyltransferase TrmB [Paenibacillus thiaminolyticus]
MRLRGKKGAPELLEQSKIAILDPQSARGRWHDIFGNGRPIHVELGMGKGQFISAMSRRHPDVNFIGIDMYDELIARACEKAEAIRGELGVNTDANLRLVRANIEYLESMFAEGEIERIFLNFSDPWPKKRHARRRLTHPRFIEKYKHVLNERGEIHQKTDSVTLFEYSLNSYAEVGLQMRNISLDLHRDGPHPDHVMTEYEEKFSSRGMNIHRVEVLVGREAYEQYRASLPYGKGRQPVPQQ